MGKLAKVAAYAAMCLIWGSTWLMIKVGLEGSPPLAGAALRFMVASIIIALTLALARIALPRSTAFWAVSLFLGVFQIGLPYALVYWGEQFISSGLAAILFSVMPISVALMAKAMIGDPLGLKKIGGVMLGTAGLGVIFANGLKLGGEMAAWGSAAVIGSALLASLSSVVVKKYCQGYHPLASLLVPMALGAMLLALWSCNSEDWRSISLDSLTVGSFLYLALFGSVAAFALYFWIIKHIDVTLLAYQTFIIPIISCLLGWVFLDETVGARVILGGGLIFAGIALVVVRKGHDGGPRLG